MDSESWRERNAYAKTDRTTTNHNCYGTWPLRVVEHRPGALRGEISFGGSQSPPHLHLSLVGRTGGKDVRHKHKVLIADVGGREEEGRVCVRADQLASPFPQFDKELRTGERNPDVLGLSPLERLGAEELGLDAATGEASLAVEAGTAGGREGADNAVAKLEVLDSYTSLDDLSCELVALRLRCESPTRDEAWRTSSGERASLVPEAAKTAHAP